MKNLEFIIDLIFGRKSLTTRIINSDMNKLQLLLSYLIILVVLSRSGNNILKTNISGLSADYLILISLLIFIVGAVVIVHFLYPKYKGRLIEVLVFWHISAYFWTNLLSFIFFLFVPVSSGVIKYIALKVFSIFHVLYLVTRLR